MGLMSSCFNLTIISYYSILSLIEEGGDWDRRNRLKVYQGYYSMTIRDFKTAAASFLDSISTFTSYELMEYKRFVVYTIIVSMIALQRNELRNKVGVNVCFQFMSFFV